MIFLNELDVVLKIVHVTLEHILKESVKPHRVKERKTQSY